MVRTSEGIPLNYMKKGLALLEHPSFPLNLFSYAICMWEQCGALVRALDLQSEGRGFESHLVRMPLDKAFCPPLSLSTQVQ